MKSIRRFPLILLILGLCAICLAAYAESVLELPSSIVHIEKEAFYGAESIDRVILPKGIRTIGRGAFANSSVKSINLPSSIVYIADDAFDGSQLSDVTATQGTYAYNWAVAHHYIDECPVSGRIFYFAGMMNEGHYYSPDSMVDLSARITSTVALKKVKASVLYRGGLNDGLKACSDVEYICNDNVFSFETYATNLEYGIDCTSLPEGPLKLVLSAELVDGRQYNVDEYDFEVVQRCKIVSLVNDKLQLALGEVSFLCPTVEPANATYPASFHYVSSDPEIVTVDDHGFVQAQSKSGTAFITVYSWDWYASVTCEVVVYDAEAYADCPVSIEVWSNAGNQNQGHYHQYGKSAEFTGKITSTEPIKEIWSEVVYRGGDNDGQSAYDCSNVVYTGGINTYSINIGPSVLNTKLKFGQMPCAPLRMFLYAELMDGSIYQIYKYDFEIVEKCTSVTLNRYEKVLPFYSTFQIVPEAGPSNATYTGSFHYHSNAPYYATVDENGLVQCYDREGSATITVYSEDWAVSATCIVTVADAVLDGAPCIINALNNTSIYEPTGDRSIWLNFTPVEGGFLYDIYRATSAKGPFEMLGSTEGDNETDWWISPFTSGCTAMDNDCEENVVYYYKIQARSWDNAYSDFSNIMVAHSGINTEPVWIDSSVDEIPDYVDAADNYLLRIQGTVTSNYKLSKITASVTNEWKTVVVDKAVYPNTKSYSLSKINLNLKSIPSGLYKITITACSEDETRNVISKWFVLSNTTAEVTSEQLQQDIVQFVKSKSANIFIPESEVNAYFNQMSTWDIILMGLSDYQGIATAATKDLLTGSDYSSYMEMKYESQIIKVLDAMYKEGKYDRISISTSVTDFIEELNKLVKSGNTVKINEINNVYISNISEVDWDQLGTLLIIKDGCKRLGDVFGNIDTCTEYIQMICELFSDHTRDLEALNIIAATYNPDHDPAFTAALERIRISYKTQFGSSLRMLFEKLEKELTKTAVKKITKALLDETAGGLYTLANTVSEFLIKITGMEESGKARVKFITQYNTLTNLRQAFRNAHSDIWNCYNINGAMPTEEQITNLQITFIAARQALINLYETMEEIDDINNIGVYEYGISETKKMIMPGVERMTD